MNLFFKVNKIFKIPNIFCNSSLKQIKFISFTQSKCFLTIQPDLIISHLRKNDKLQPKYIKELDVEDIFKILAFPQEKEFNDLNLMNSIELRILKELQLHARKISSNELINLLKFFAINGRGSSKIYQEIQNMIENNVKDGNKDIPFWTQILSWMVKSNKFDYIMYKTIQNHLQNHIDSCLTNELNNLINFAQILHCLALVHVSNLEFVEKIVEILENNHQNIDKESIVNVIWSLMLFYPLNNLNSQNELRLSQIKRGLKILCEYIEEKVDKKFMQMRSPRLKYKLKQIISVSVKIFNLSSAETMFPKLSKIKMEFIKPPSEISLIHDDVTAVLAIMKEWKIHREKSIDIYIVDIFIEPNIIMEVNGPSHFVGSNHLNIGEQYMDGKSLMKQKILKECLNYQFINIGYQEWYNLKGVNAKINFLSEKVYN